MWVARKREGELGECGGETGVCGTTGEEVAGGARRSEDSEGADEEGAATSVPKAGSATEKEEERERENAEEVWSAIGAMVDVVVVEECNNETNVMGGEELSTAEEEEAQEGAAGSQVGEKGSGEAAESS